MDEEGLLEALGLTPTERRVVVALLAEPGARVTSLAQAAGVSRPRAYDVVRALVARGIVRERPGLYKRFEALPLEVVAARVVEQERARVEALANVVDAFVRARQAPPAAARVHAGEAPSGA